MAITVIVRSASGDDRSLTFDEAQRVVLGRGPGSDVRLPDPSVSHRHASVRSQGRELVVVDEGSTNGTFVGSVRVASRTSRIVRSGEWISVGRVLIQVRIDQGPATRDLAVATRDLALALVSRAIGAAGVDRATRLRVVEGPDQGTTLVLGDADSEYLVGRAAHCDLVLSDEDASREHARVSRRSDGAFVKDLSAKNGTWMGTAQIPPHSEVHWRSAQMLRIAHSVIALEDPVSLALLEIESAPDEPIIHSGLDAAPEGAERSLDDPSSRAAELVPVGNEPSMNVSARQKRKARRFKWSVVDLLVMTAAVGVLALSLVALVWVLRGSARGP